MFKSAKILRILALCLLPLNCFAVTLEEKIGQMVMIGFHGSTPEDFTIGELPSFIKSGAVGGLIFYRHNILDPDQLSALLSFLKSRQNEVPLFLAIDQEGGRVQRLNSKNGYRDFSSAKEISKMSFQESFSHYSSMAELISSAGFNLNLGPVVDLDFGELSPAIGKLDRSYSNNIEYVTQFATSFVDAHREHGILTCLKHAPGHGSARSDSHLGVTDITDYWSEAELDPYRALIAKGKTDMIMSAHVMLRNIDPTYPATLSQLILREHFRFKTGWDGVIISDDLQMQAISDHFGLEKAVIHAINAGIDILLFSNFKSFGVKLPLKVREIILQAIDKHEISEEQIDHSFERIMALKKRIHRS